MSKPWFSVKNLATQEGDGGCCEVCIYEQIGKDWWSEEGIGAKDFAQAWAAIPKSQPVKLRINSSGGNVWDGLAIYNLIKERSASVTCYIDGICFSIASIIALAAGKVICPKNALWMIHDPSTTCEGTADEMRQQATMLDAHKDSLVSIYVNETGLSDSEVRKMMSNSTWMTGEEASAKGFVDELTEDVAIAASFSLSKFLKKEPKDTANNTTPQNMKQKLLLDAQAGATSGGGGPAATATPTATPPTNAAGNAPTNVVSAAELAEVRNQLNAVNQQLAAERRNSVERQVDGYIAEGRIVASQRGFWVDAILRDPKAAEAAQAIQPVRPGSDPLNPMVEIKNESLADIGKHMRRLREPQNAFARGEAISQPEIIASAKAASQFHWHNYGRMQEILNANTIDTNLKRNVILQDVVRAFALKILPLNAFSTVWGALRLEGTDAVAVPYFPLVATASTDFVQANGYVMGDSTQNSKLITINKRKYQPIRFNSAEIARQPALNLMEIAKIKAEKLAVDIFNDVLSLVTVANYGASVTTGAASAFDGSDIADLKGAADTAQWPDGGRSLIIKSAFDVNFLKSGLINGSYLSYQNYGTVDPIQDGKVKNIMGFNYYTTEQIPANGETLQGLIAYKSGILFATSYVPPSEEIRRVMSAYEVVMHPTLGIGIEYRLWGSADNDERREVIEANYGYAPGEAAAIKRISTT